MTRVGDLRALAVDLVGALRREELAFMAAAIAYYAFVTAIPLVLVGVAVATAVGGEALAQELVAGLRGVLTRDAAAVLESALTSSAGRSEATVVGLAVLAWSGLRLFRAIETAFARIYGTRGESTLPERIARALVAFLAIGVGTIATVVLAVALPLATLPLAGFLGTVLAAATLAALFLPLYVLLPAGDHGIRETLPGALLAGGGWGVLGAVFGVYADNASAFELYGVLGGVLLLLTFLYLGGLVVILGAVLNATLATGE